MLGRIDPAVLSTITAWCAEQGALADDVQVARRSLENVFLELTGRSAVVTAASHPATWTHMAEVVRPVAATWTHMASGPTPRRHVATYG